MRIVYPSTVTIDTSTDCKFKLISKSLSRSVQCKFTGTNEITVSSFTSKTLAADDEFTFKLGKMTVTNARTKTGSFTIYINDGIYDILYATTEFK